jgi:hypothetical protein
MRGGNARDGVALSDAGSLEGRNPMSGCRRRLRQDSERIKPSRSCETTRTERSGCGKSQRRARKRQPTVGLSLNAEGEETSKEEFRRCWFPSWTDND